MAYVERDILEHVCFDLVEHMHKIEEVHAETEKLVKIMEDFHNKISTSQFMEHYLTWLVYIIYPPDQNIGA